MATATMRRKIETAKAKVLAAMTKTKRMETFPQYARDGISAREFLRALTNGMSGLVKMVFLRSGGYTADVFLSLPEFQTKVGGKLDEPIELAVVGTSDPYVELAVRESVYGSAAQWSLGVTIPLSLNDRNEQVATPGGGIASVGFDTAFKYPADPDHVRIARARLEEAGCSLILHAGNALEGFVLLSSPVTVEAAREMSARLAQRIEGAARVQVIKNEVPAMGAAGTFGLERAWLPAEQPLRYHLPIDRPLHRIIPRQEATCVGDPTHRVAPDEVLR